jgi:hypothetical protein
VAGWGGRIRTSAFPENQNSLATPEESAARCGKRLWLVGSTAASRISTMVCMIVIPSNITNGIRRLCESRDSGTVLGAAAVKLLHCNVPAP